MQDKLTILSNGRTPSTWSYSYDLNLNHMCEEALREEIKSKCSGADVADKLISRFTLDEDPKDHNIFQGSREIHELAAINVFRELVTEALNYDSLVDTEEHRISKPRNNLESATVNEMEQSVDNVKCLRSSDVEKQQSWLGKVIRPFSKKERKSDKTKHRNKEKINHQIHSTFVDYLEQLRQKAAIPSFQTLEELQLEFCREKMKWSNQVDFLKQRNSILTSELQDFKRAYRKATEQWTNLKTFYSQNQTVVGRNFGMNPDLQMIS